ncbi:DUF983 domain-containing protein [Lichenifustis flavocetrariae]|uniref:DUF983 domain-containing protein n=1 Tax=Lichenifustis flavocetrariae TaxID=2949735 RepID=A0AA41Z0N0_9HYPH|nr:DUF983 domain-containing protein [Lichenifustis flavocetrariae]MCW6510680.1 DUF983 domain-containing protein [Lichenifustis flavocetrariae]
MVDSLNDEYPPIPAISTGLLGRCPRCGSGRLFRGFLTLGPRCDHCGLDYGFADAGDGPAVFVTLIVGTIVVGLALILDIAYEPPIWVHMVISLPLAVLLCLAVLRPLKGVLVALQYRNKAEQGRLG